MKKSAYLFVAIPLAALLLSAGCKKDESNPVDSGSNAAQSSGQPTPSFGAVADYNGALAAIQYDVESPLPGFPSVQSAAAVANLGAAGGVDAGSVSVNSFQLGKLVTSGKTTYIAPDPGNPFASMDAVSFNGANHSWSVTGGNGIPSFSGSVKSVSSFNLVSPANNATVGKSSDLTVTWNGGTQYKALIQVTNISSGKTKVYQELTDNGSYKISAADLAELGGSCLLYVVKYNYNIISAGGKKYVLIAEIVKSIKVNIN